MARGKRYTPSLIAELCEMYLSGESYRAMRQKVLDEDGRHIDDSTLRRLIEKGTDGKKAVQPKKDPYTVKTLEATLKNWDEVRGNVLKGLEVQKKLSRPKRVITDLHGCRFK